MKVWESIQHRAIASSSSTIGRARIVVPWTVRTVGRDGLEVEARITLDMSTIRDGAVRARDHVLQRA